MSYSGPQITIVVAAHNRLSVLKRALQSALSQDHTSFEVLVVDDGSDQPTRSWLDELSAADDRVRIRHQHHGGVGKARQVGLMESTGELICVLDSDDELLPNALRKLAAVFDVRPAADLVYANYFNVLPSGASRVVRLPTYSSNRSMIRAALVRPVVPFKHSGTTYRRRVALEVGGYDTSLRQKIDVDLFLRFLNAGRCLRLLEDPVVRFHMHANSISRARIEGLRAWNVLIARYGPAEWPMRTCYKGLRTAAECLKLLYERALLR